MRKFLQVGVLTASSLFSMALLGNPIVGEAKTIPASGLNESDATIVDKAGKVYTHSEVLSPTVRYTVKYKWAIENGITINDGDTMNFYLPLNVYVPKDASFPLTSLSLIGNADTIGTASVPKGTHVGTVTLNNVLNSKDVIRKGYINLYVNGYEDENTGGETPGGENPGGETPGGENPGGETPGGENPGGETPGGENPGGETPGGENPGGENPGGETPGGENPGGETPGGENPGGENPGGEKPGIEGPGTEVPGVGGETPGVTPPTNPGTTNPGTTNPGTTTPGTIAPGTSTPGNEEVPGKPGVNVPVVTGGSGSNITGANTTSTSAYKPSTSINKPGIAAAQQQQPAKPSVATNNAVASANTAAANSQPAKHTLPQTNEQSDSGWAMLGLSLLGFGLGFGFHGLRRRKQQ